MLWRCSNCGAAFDRRPEQCTSCGSLTSYDITGQRLPTQTAARLLRAKAHELEAAVHNHVQIDPIFLAADIALVAGLLADYMEQDDQTPR